MYKDLKDFKTREEYCINYWKKNDILNKSIDQNKKDYIFYDGPATANGMPGVHHVMAKLLKDSVCKYKTMRGYRVRRKIGWDTHGLPVEVQVEKELGFTSKDDIEKYGVAKFNKQCRKSVMENEKSFKDLTHKMGQFIDTDNPYITFKNEYIETEWHILKKMHEDDLIYEGLKILPWCPRCQTGLASHEVAQGYQNIKQTSVYAKFKVKDEENTYFLVWTTTPWTLLSNVALAVNPQENYSKIKVGQEFLILATPLVDSLFEEKEIVSTFKGSELEYVKYNQLIPVIKKENAFYVTLADYVSMDSGTGVVHIAPAFGEDDYQVALKYNLPFISPIDDKGMYTEGPWKDRFVLDEKLNLEIIDYLKKENLVFKKEKIEHSYPHCWRCKTPLIYYSKDSLYIKTTAFKDEILKAAGTVNWFPEYVGEKRFKNWLENMKDWAISRNRYWGCPIPLWKCDCGHEEMIGSIEELRQRSLHKLGDDLDLHKPYVDEIVLSCPKCQGKMKRIKDVIDCWFDSGSMPFAQVHYPFSSSLEKNYPADFISEGIDQTRGWFYSLLVIGVYMTGKAPYKNVLVNDLLLDKDGQKMSKSRGNIVEPFSLIEEFGADPIRFYMFYTSPVWTPMMFDKDGIREVNGRFFRSLTNIYNFFKIYANIDNLSLKDLEDDLKPSNKIDEWFISKYNSLIKDYVKAFDEYNPHRVVRLLDEFVVEDFSNWYIRRNRRRFWKSEMDEEKFSVYKITYEVLLGVLKMLAPISPFISEEIYQNLTGGLSVHLEKIPEVDEGSINQSLENSMILIRKLISMGRSVREKKEVKVRQPLKEVVLDQSIKKEIGELDDLIKDELNVKEITFTNNLDKYLNFDVRPNYKEAGNVFKNEINNFRKALSNLSEEAKKQVLEGKEINLDNFGVVEPIYMDIVLKDTEGFDAALEDKLFIILNTTLDDDLILEGIYRELINKIQTMRKEKDLNIVDKIVLYLDQSMKDVLDLFKENIMKETLVEKIVFQENTKNIKLNDREIYLNIKKVSDE